MADQESGGLSVFRQKLQELLPRDASRPFLCSGDPLQSRAFIVGLNPATSLGVDFWKYWSDTNGLDRNALMSRYDTIRRRKGVRPRIERIVDSAGVPCLETNIFAHPTPRARDLSGLRVSTAPFNLMFDFIKPSIMFVHSNGPMAYMSRALNLEVTSDVQDVEWRGHTFKIFGRPGPLFRTSYDGASAIGLRISSCLG